MKFRKIHHPIPLMQNDFKVSEFCHFAIELTKEGKIENRTGLFLVISYDLKCFIEYI